MICNYLQEPATQVSASPGTPSDGLPIVNQDGGK